MSEWITDRDAIFTIIKMGFLEVGDELKVVPVGEDWPGAWPNATPGVARISALPREGATCYWLGPDTPCVATAVKLEPDAGQVWSCCIENIVAWRRPEK